MCGPHSHFATKVIAYTTIYNYTSQRKSKCPPKFKTLFSIAYSLQAAIVMHFNPSLSTAARGNLKTHARFGHTYARNKKKKPQQPRSPRDCQSKRAIANRLDEGGEIN